MGVLSRWLRPPAEFRTLMDGTERILAMADAPVSVVIATQFGLWLPQPGQEPPWRRIGWDRIVKATWTELGLELVEGDLDSDGLVTDRPALAIRLSEPRNLPAVVRERVQTSIARSEQVLVPGGTGRIVARRVPGVDGYIWTARIDSGTPDSFAARALLADYCRQARNSATPD